VGSYPDACDAANDPAVGAQPASEADDAASVMDFLSGCSLESEFEAQVVEQPKIFRSFADYQPPQLSDFDASVAAGPPVREMLTVIVTSSPVMSNPLTSMIEHVFETMCQVPGLADCSKILVCDGHKLMTSKTKTTQWKSGKITENQGTHYQSYIEACHGLAERGAPGFRNTQVLELPDRHGFAFAVQAALDHVRTPYVMVIQHDHSFARAFDLPKLLRTMEATPEEYKYVGLLSASTMNYPRTTLSKFNVRVEPKEVGGLGLVPLLFWYDKTHICTVKYYREFIFTQPCIR
jgi:hypothetical protein